MDQPEWTSDKDSMKPDIEGQLQQKVVVEHFKQVVGISDSALADLQESKVRVALVSRVTFFFFMNE